MQLLEEIKHFSRWRQQRVAKIVHCGPPGYTLSTRRHLQVNARGTWSEWQILGHFSQLLEETEHFRGWGQEKDAKIVQCGESAWL